MSDRLNEDVAGRLEEVARLLAAQGANRFRVRAYERAAQTLRRLSRPVSEILEQQGVEGLQTLPGVGISIARAIRDLLARGRLAMLERLRGESDPTKLLASVPASAASWPIASITISGSRRSRIWKPPRTMADSSRCSASAQNALQAFAIPSRIGSSVSSRLQPPRTVRPRSQKSSMWTASIVRRQQPDSS